VLERLGSKHVLVVYGLDGLDEISISGPTMVGELAQGQINEYNIHPSELGMELYDRRAIEVHTVAESKAMIQAVLDGQPGPAHNIVALNAGAAIYVAGVSRTLKAGVERAAQAIKSGAAKQKLEEFVAFTQKVKARA
jgi:anthranilate phosphoribosyltransferase